LSSRSGYLCIISHSLGEQQGILYLFGSFELELSNIVECIIEEYRPLRQSHVDDALLVMKGSLELGRIWPH